QQEERRRVFGAGFSVKDGKPIDRYRAIKSRMFHGRFLLLGLGQTLKRGKHHRNDQSFERGSKHQAETSKITSSSTGAPSGRLATPYTNGKGSCPFRRHPAATPKRRRPPSAGRGHLPKWPPTRRAGRSASLC